MKRIDDSSLCNIKGGADITSTLVNAFTNVIKVLFDAGHSVGSAIRRFAEGDLCPLD